MPTSRPAESVFIEHNRALKSPQRHAQNPISQINTLRSRTVDRCAATFEERLARGLSRAPEGP